MRGFDSVTGLGGYGRRFRWNDAASPVFFPEDFYKKDGGFATKPTCWIFVTATGSDWCG